MHDVPDSDSFAVSSVGRLSLLESVGVAHEDRVGKSATNQTRSLLSGQILRYSLKSQKTASTV